MDDLIRALQIFLKYRNLDNPTYCEHDTLCVYATTFSEVGEDDRNELERLGFFWSAEDGEDTDEGCWMSFRYGN